MSLSRRGPIARYLRTYAREVLERIERDRQEAPGSLRPVLAYLHDNLSNPEVNVDHLRKNLGLRDAGLIEFHSQLGEPVSRYPETRRMETASRLLADSDLTVWVIGELVGYRTIQVFSRAFKRWAGESASTYRRKKRRRKPRSAEATRPPSPEILRLAILGELESELACELIARLRLLYEAKEPAR